MFKSPSGCVVLSASGFVAQENLIERIAVQKAYQHKKISYYDLEDIKQEVRIKCWAALPKYDPQKFKTNLHVFLSVCAENRLRDIRRSVMYKHSKPCFKCPFWNEQAAQSGVHDCRVFDNKMECDKYRKHERYVQAKLSASMPIDINSRMIEDKNSLNKVNLIDMIDFIRSRLSSNLLPIFDKFVNSNFNIKALRPKDRMRLIPELRVILVDFER
jgi:hypothetical protein